MLRYFVRLHNPAFFGGRGCVDATATTMKLLTHNFMSSPVKGVQNGYPLRLEATKTEERDAEFNAEFMARMVGKIDYAAARIAADAVRPSVAH